MVCTMEPRLRLKRSPPQAGLEPGTARSVGQHLTTEQPELLGCDEWVDGILGNVVSILHSGFCFVCLGGAQKEISGQTD